MKDIINDETLHAGGCMCGQVRYEVRGPLRGVIACHCSQCRRSSGHYAAMTSAPAGKITMSRADSLVWFRSSDTAERAFCGTCGSNLFWKLAGRDSISITAGTLDLPTGIALEQHIFVADKSDYYSIDDDLPQLPRW